LKQVLVYLIILILNRKQTYNYTMVSHDIYT